MTSFQTKPTAVAARPWRNKLMATGAAMVALGVLACAPTALANDESSMPLQSMQAQQVVATTAPVKSLAAATVIVEDQSYSGKPLTPIPTVKVGGKTLIQFIDYTCSYESNVIPGTATVTVTGIGAYSDSATATFKISGTASMKDTSVAMGNQVFTGAALTPAPRVTCGGQELVAGRDYSVTYVNNVNSGTAAMTITGKGSFTRSKTVLFKIGKADVSSAVIGAIAAKPHTGSALTPEPSVTFEGKRLVNGEDFDLSYEHNVKPGIATVTVTGKGNFTGTQSSQFKIAKASLAKAKIAKIESVFATGIDDKPATPAIKLICAGKTPKKDVDYTVTYKNNVKPGIATITVKGQGDYTGVVTAKFKITNIGDDLARKACELSYSQQRWVKNGYKGTRAYLDAYNQHKKKNSGPPASCSVGMQIAICAANYDAAFKINTAQDCSYLDFWGRKPGNAKWTCLGDYSKGMELQPGDILLGDKKKGVNHIFMYVGSEIAQEVYDKSLRGTDADVGAPYGEWVSAHVRYGAGGDGAALCICDWKTASASHDHYKVFRCTKPDWR